MLTLVYHKANDVGTIVIAGVPVVIAGLQVVIAGYKLLSLVYHKANDVDTLRWLTQC